MPTGSTQLDYIEFLRDVGPHFTINRMLTFDSVKLRLEREQPLTFLEFNYMILQAYDFLRAVARARLPAADGRLGPVGQYRQRRRARPADRRDRGLRPDHAADHHRRRRQDGQDRARRGLAQRRPAQPLRLLAILAQHRGRATSAASCACSPTCRSTRSRGWRRCEGAEINDAKKVLADAATAMLHGADAAAERGGDGAADLRGRRSRRGAADAEGDVARSGWSTR